MSTRGRTGLCANRLWPRHSVGAAYNPNTGVVAPDRTSTCFGTISSDRGARPGGASWFIAEARCFVPHHQSRFLSFEYEPDLIATRLYGYGDSTVVPMIPNTAIEKSSASSRGGKGLRPIRVAHELRICNNIHKPYGFAPGVSADKEEVRGGRLAPASRCPACSWGVAAGEGKAGRLTFYGKPSRIAPGVWRSGGRG